MNGDPEDSSGQQNRRTSVWNVLDRMVPYTQPSGGLPATSADNNQTFEASLMLYAPLIPDEDSHVILAKSKLIEVVAAEKTPVLPKVVAKGVFSALWPEKFKLRFKKKDGSKSSSSDIEAQAPADTTPQNKKGEKSSEVKVWIPSKTKLSLQVAWWGYRLWLPPPVMKILDDKTVEAAKRAAMVTTALAWIINNIPLAGLPPQLAAAVALLKGIVPILGYVGGFIAWSWSQVRSFDKGQGVVLSATWLLPIALIPGTWDDSDYGGDPGSDSGRGTPTPPEAPSGGLPQPRTPGTSTPATGDQNDPGQVEPLPAPDKKS
ncbi:hypothetical protein FRC03_007377 [Tulasnella sp. 419]|nr:hypothetical protein FRC03_007377 [Tulasnella sp. 419]